VRAIYPSGSAAGSNKFVVNRSLSIWAECRISDERFDARAETGAKRWLATIRPPRRIVMAYVDGIVATVPAEVISAAATLPVHVSELLRASSGASSTSVLLLSAAAGAAGVFAAGVGLARTVRRAGQARQQVMRV